MSKLIKPAVAPAKSAGPVSQCFALWDSIAGGELIPRSMAVELAIAEGVNQWTARTQFQRWLTARRQTA